MTNVGVLTAVWRQNEKIRFLAIGAWNTLFGYLCFAIAYLLLAKHLHYLLIGLLAHGLSVINSFYFQRQFVFKSRLNWWPAFWRFNVVQLIVLCWGLTGLFLTVEILHMHPLLGQLLVMCVSVVGSYILSRHYAFRSNGEGKK